MNIITTKDWILKIKDTHEGKYDYSKAEYINSSTKVCIICPEHGEFWQSPISHLKGHGCQKCGKVKEKKSVIENKLKKKFKDLVQPEEYKLIPLTQGKYAIVDNEDFERLKDINWCYSNGYAINDEHSQIHRYIMDAPDDMLVDHEDGNPLNNRKSNLRLATLTQNNRNSKAHKNKTSKFKGVSWDKRKGKWRANIYYQNKQNFLGYYTDEIECAKAYDKVASKIWGQFAYLNFK